MNTTMRWAALAVAVTLTLLISANASAHAQQTPATTDVDIRVWQRISNSADLAVSVRPEGRAWADLGTISLDMDHTSRSGIWRYDQVATAGVEVRVWQRLSNFRDLYISARPVSGS